MSNIQETLHLDSQGVGRHSTHKALFRSARVSGGNRDLGATQPQSLGQHLGNGVVGASFVRRGCDRDLERISVLPMI